MKSKLWRLFLRAVRAVTLAVDDWVQAQEVKLREPAQRAAALAEVDRAASAAREKEFSGQRQQTSLRRTEKAGKAFGTPFDVDGARTRKAAPRNLRGRQGHAVKMARLVYQTGQFVREGV